MDLDALYRDNIVLLVRMLELKLGVPEEAKDIAHEAFARLARQSQHQDIGNIRSYLFSIASNLATDRLRQRHRRREADRLDPVEIDYPTDEPDVERHLLAREAVARILILLDELTPRCRHAFIQHRLEARRYEDIAAEMGLTESMVRKYVLTAMRHCLSRMSEEDMKVAYDG
ncbi:RNA polymerase sigma factor [Novosphingobium sp. CF614]|uniref:RNA polymerase sigma factor n=1 Tax=Novosphingobium sp. CF614 TaxID=1884364 RepID=UPI000B84558C|nr:RNA polymerase sigma factor [Novosphingobium sp. CF614]